MTAQININNYSITYDENAYGEIKITEVYKGNHDITKSMDNMLRARLVDEVKDALEENQQAHEWAAQQDYLDEIEEKN